MFKRFFHLIRVGRGPAPVIGEDIFTPLDWSKLQADPSEENLSDMEKQIDARFVEARRAINEWLFGRLMIDGLVMGGLMLGAAVLIALAVKWG